MLVLVLVLVLVLLLVLVLGARRSALKRAACLDVVVAHSRLAPHVASQGKATLVRIVSTTTS